MLSLFRVADERLAADGDFDLSGELASAATTSALVDTLAEADDDRGLLNTVIYVLGLKGDPDAFDSLLPFLGPAFEYKTPDGGMSTQALAADSIGKIGLAVRRAGDSCPRRVGETLVASHHPGASSWIISAVGAVGYTDGADMLLSSLTSPSSGDRHAAAWGLGELGDPTAIEPLTRALAAEHDPAVRQSISDALNGMS